MIIFGGGKTSKIKIANGYASMFERLVKFYKLDNVHIYSADYDSISDDRKQERKIAFIAARSRVLNKDVSIQPVDDQYIHDLYNIVIRPRIIDKNGKKYPDDIALHNVRNAIIFAHCHGPVPVRAFQDIMAPDMKSVGYSQPKIREIMKNLLVIQHAPMSPLEKSRFNTVSFMSANDPWMNFYNKFSEYVSQHDEELSASYFPLGNFFATNGFTHNYRNEHSVVGLVPTEEQDKLTPDGAIIMAAERNAIVNGIRAAKAGAAMPNIRDLIAPASSQDIVKPDFDILVQNGETFMAIMRYDMRTERSGGR